MASTLISAALLAGSSTAATEPETSPSSHASDEPSPARNPGAWSSETTYEWLSLNPHNGRLLRRWALRFDIGCGGGVAGMVARTSLGFEIRLTAHWGLGGSATTDLSGVSSAPHILAGAEARGFWETSVPEGWLRIEAGLGPALIGTPFWDCGDPLCGYPPTSSVGLVASLALIYWFPVGVDHTIGPAVRAQTDQFGDVTVTANFVLSSDLLDMGQRSR